MAKARAKLKIDAQLVEVGGSRIVIMDEGQYDYLLDAIDAVEAERIATDQKDRILSWDEVKDDFIVNRIAEVREKLGITQKELARRLNVRQSTVSRMEREDANLTLSTLRKVAKALGCSVHQLLS
jgi:DNA-binding XRE family transcriptional regulator